MGPDLMLERLMSSNCKRKRVIEKEDECSGLSRWPQYYSVSPK